MAAIMYSLWADNVQCIRKKIPHKKVHLNFTMEFNWINLAMRISIIDINIMKRSSEELLLYQLLLFFIEKYL